MAGVFGAEVDRALAVLAAGGTLEDEALDDRSGDAGTVPEVGQRGVGAGGHDPRPRVCGGCARGTAHEHAASQDMTAKGAPLAHNT